MSIRDELDLNKNIEWTADYDKQLAAISKPFNDAAALVKDASAQIKAANDSYQAALAKPVSLLVLEERDTAKTKLDRLKRVREAAVKNLELTRRDERAKAQQGLEKLKAVYMASANEQNQVLSDRVSDLRKQLAIAEAEQDYFWRNVSGQWGDHVSGNMFSTSPVLLHVDGIDIQREGTMGQQQLLGANYVNNLMAAESKGDK